MTRLATALLLLLLAASASGAGQKLDDKCCRISWRNQRAGFTGHGEWTKEFYAMSWLRAGCFVPSYRVPVVASGQGLCLKFADAEKIRQKELYFGDYGFGRFGWITSDLFRLPEPIPFKAKQGLCDVPDDVVHQIRDQFKGGAI